MASERGRALLIFGIVGAVAAAGGYYFFGVYRPKQVRAAAAAEVTAWERRWTDARGCLLGAEPASAKTREALAVHELAPDPWDRGACTKPMSKLTRGDAAPTGLGDVEQAWRDLDAAATKAAQAFAEHINPTLHTKSDPLPDALDALDAARAHLRDSVGLPPGESGARTPLPVALLVPIRAPHGDHLREIDFRFANNPAGALASAVGDHAGYEIVLAPGAAPHVVALPPRGWRALDGSWGAAMDADGNLVAGAVGDDGAMPAPATVAHKAVEVFGAVGSAGDGVAIYMARDEKTPPQEEVYALGFAHMGSAAPVLEPLVRAAHATTTAEPSGRFAIAWNAAYLSNSSGDLDEAADAKRAAAPPPTYLRLFGPGLATTAKAVAVPGRFPLDGACFSKDLAWIALDRDGLVAFDGQSAKLFNGTGAHLVGCSPDGAIVRFEVPDGTLAWSLCAPDGSGVVTCPELKLPRGTQPGAVPTTIDRKPVALAVHDGVVAVWRDGQPAAFYAVPDAPAGLTTETRVAYTDGNVFDLPVLDAKGDYAIIRVPAK